MSTSDYACGAAYCDDPACTVHNDPELERSVDLTVRCSVDVRITVAEPYDAGDVFDLVYSELAWDHELVSVDDVRVDGPAASQVAADAAVSRIRRLFERVLRG